jgi:hypothetical protein
MRDCWHAICFFSCKEVQHMESETESGSERRHLERFSITATAVVQTMSAGTERVFELQTRDISSGGAFFPMEVPLPTGEKVKITLFLSFSGLEQIQKTPGASKIMTEGQVVRSDSHGIAVEFGKRYTMAPILA